MTDSYPFPIYSGLLESRHYKNIGTAIWFFLWCVSSSTSEEERDGERWGNVHGKKPLKLAELAEPFGVNCKTISRWLEALEQHEYIQVTRAPYGLIIQVRKSKKFLQRTDKNVLSDGVREWTKMSILPSGEETKMSDLDEENGQKCLICPERSDKNVLSNKDIKDITITTTTNEDDEIFGDYKIPKTGMVEILDAYCKMHQRLDIHIKPHEREAMGKMVSGGIPVPFTIRTMELLFEEKQKREGARFKPPSSFLYYVNAIQEAWQNEQISQTDAQVPTLPSVAPGYSSKNNQRGGKQNGISGKHHDGTAGTAQSYPFSGQSGRLRRKSNVPLSEVQG